MTSRLGRRTLADRLVPSSSWTLANLGSVGTAHMTTLAASNHDVPMIGVGGTLATPRASGRDTLQALVLLVGTLGILFGLALVVGKPMTGIQ